MLLCHLVCVCVMQEVQPDTTTQNPETPIPHKVYPQLSPITTTHLTLALTQP